MGRVGSVVGRGPPAYSIHPSAMVRAGGRGDGDTHSPLGGRPDRGEQLGSAACPKGIATDWPLRGKDGRRSLPSLRSALLYGLTPRPD